LEHLQHFGLGQDPFSNEPDLRFYYESAYHRDALMRVERGLRQSKALTVLSGDTGTGKSLIARRIFDRLEEEVFEVNMMVMLPGAAEAQAVLSGFARQLGIEAPASERSGLLGQVFEQLAIVREDGRHAVLVIDDAHVLSRGALAEIAGLLNMEYEERRLLSLLLVGTPELIERLGGDLALLHRVDVRVQLQSLDHEATSAYVAHRLELGGGASDLITQSAVEALFKFGRGRPRLINTLADNALFEAYLAGRGEVDAADVEHAALDLGIGPDPGTTYSQATSGVRRAPAAPRREARSVMGELTDPGSGPALEANRAMGGGRGLDADLDALLEGDGPLASEELTSVLHDDAAPDDGSFDLDVEVEAALASRPRGGGAAQRAPARTGAGREALPSFRASNAQQNSMAEATRIALDDDDSVVEVGVEDLDDLFVELIED
jgi:type II secretory pathway predicted ATPase ExeA